MSELGRGTLARQMWSSRQLYEVMVDFWSNHLNVTNPFDGGWDVRTPYDHESSARTRWAGSATCCTPRRATRR